jgi:hypothetical protein
VSNDVVWVIPPFSPTTAPQWTCLHTYTAASCSQPDVAAAAALVVDGDCLTVPAGTCTWTIPVTITKSIWFSGAGEGQTVFIDNVPKDGTPQSPHTTCAGGSPLISFVAMNGSHPRISGFTIQGMATDPLICQPGHISIAGTSTTLRIDHITVTNQKTGGFRLYGCLYGVGDHVTMNANHNDGFIIFHSGCYDGGAYGDGSWATASSVGTANAWFIEDSIFSDPSAQGAGSFDGWGGMRVVFRHNTSGFIVGHGTESPQRARGMRQFEIYSNTFTAQAGGADTAIYLRSGTGVIFNNTFLSSYNSIAKAAEDRDTDAFPPWGGSGAAGGCDGSKPFDKNDGVVYASGTHTGANTSNVMTDSTKNFTVNQWNTGYSIRNTTAGWGSIISSNTATTVTNGTSAFGQSRVWANGDSYQILQAYPCLDQIGRGAGDVLSGANPTPEAWPHQVLDPLYLWGNTFNGNGSPLLANASLHVQTNRDYYDNTTKPGYTPYTYPHPLQAP